MYRFRIYDVRFRSFYFVFSYILHLIIYIQTKWLTISKLTSKLAKGVKARCLSKPAALAKRGLQMVVMVETAATFIWKSAKTFRLYFLIDIKRILPPAMAKMEAKTTGRGPLAKILTYQSRLVAG